MPFIASIRRQAGAVLFHALRAVEVVLDPTALRVVVWPVALGAALAEVSRLGELEPAGAGLALFPDAGRPTRISRLAVRIRFHLTRLLLMLPDRLASPRWESRCRIEGEANLRAAVASGRPIVLATLHFGADLLLRYWLRARGYPVATLVAGRLADRTALQRHKDSLSPPAGVPNVFAGGSPRGAMEFLRDGGILMVMVDHPAGRQIEMRVPGGCWRISSTALRMAAHTGAIVLPALSVEEAPWRFVVRVGSPVPDEWLEENGRFVEAAGHLWSEFAPILRTFPDECFWELLGSLRGVGRTPSDTAA